MIAPEISSLEFLEKQGYSLGFLGVRNGSSTSHTNAFFYPDEETLVIIDLSLLNVEKAKRLVRPTLKQVYILVTHLHPDHASGVVMFCYHIRHHLRGVTPTIVVDRMIAQEANQMFRAEGGRTLYLENDDGIGKDAIYNLLITGATAWDMFAKFDMRDLDLVPLKQKPDWLVSSIPTEHAPRLVGASGFSLQVGERRIVYTGDTNTLEPFKRELDRIYCESPNAEVEFYLEVASKPWPVHIFYPNFLREVKSHQFKYPKAKVILMHYDDREYFLEAIKTLNAFFSNVCLKEVFLAKEAF